MTTQARRDAADDLQDAWEAVMSAHTTAMRALRDSGASTARFDAYLSPVFDPESRMLGMQSVGQWVDELAGALEDAADALPGWQEV